MTKRFRKILLNLYTSSLNFLLNLKRSKKRSILILTDILLVFFSCYLAFSLRLGFFFSPRIHEVWLFLIASFLAPIIFSYFGLYRAVIRYIGYKALLSIMKANGLLVIFWVMVSHYILPKYFEVEIKYFLDTLPIIFWMNLLLFVGGIRQIARWILGRRETNSKQRNIIVYGAGNAGRILIESLSKNKYLNVIGFIDDNPLLKNQLVGNFKVFGGIDKIEKLREKFDSLTVLLAMSNMKRSKRREILDFLEDKMVNVRNLPSLSDIALGKLNISDLQAIDIHDLLGRRSIKPNRNLISKHIEKKSILVTGAGGSIGSELCRQIMKLFPEKLIILDQSEYNLYRIEMELRNLAKEFNIDVEIIVKLSSVRNFSSLNQLFSAIKIDTIYHAAAYKHVPLVENNIIEGMSNNVIGTYNVSMAAYNHSVRNFVLVSTDKAVRPTNIMGATKRIAELVIQGISSLPSISQKENDRTKFSIVRFGNVLGSSGSVIPLFNDQIKRGGPVTVTHPDVTRFFMTVSEAAQLVMQAGSMGSGGEVYVLDMGEPVSINKLAKRMIHLSGFQVAGADDKIENSEKIIIQYTGLRDGEKLFEELLISDDVHETEHPKIMKANEECFEWKIIELMIDDLNKHIEMQNIEKTRDLVRMYVNDYRPEKNG